MTEQTTKPESPFSGLSDCATLNSKDEYALYFNHLWIVFERLLMVYYSSQSRHSYEAVSIRIYLNKLLYSIQALRKKYTYNPAHSLKIDLTESGFPNFLEISYLSVDLMNKKDRLIVLPPATMLKGAMLDHMFHHREDPKDLLWQMSERDYFQMLEADKLFLSFTPGKLEVLSESDKARSYIFSWGCYDFKTNRPYIHILTFEQDISAEALHYKGANYHQFLEIVKAEGSRVPDVGLLALSIDNDLESIHPKVLKRICIGPLHSHRACVGNDGLCNILEKYSRTEQDFILLMKDEVVFSVRQQELESGALSPRRVREIFHLPETDLELYQAKASTIHYYMMMPHRVLQHMRAEGALNEYERYRKISFDQEGNIHGVL